MNVLGVPDRPQCECGKRGRLRVLAVWAVGAEPADLAEPAGR